MSTDTGPDRPPQRTVAELLAAHGGGQPTSGRRRARRDAAADQPPSRRAERRSAAPEADGDQQAWPPAGDLSASDGPAGNEPLNLRGPALLPESPPDWRAPDALSAGLAAPPASQPAAGWRPSVPDPRWSAPQAPPAATGADGWLHGAPPTGQPPRQSRRELREAREAGLSQLDGMLPLPGDVDGRIEGNVGGQLQAPRAYQSPPAQRAARAPGPLFVEHPTEQIPRITEPVGPNGSNGHRVASAPTADRPAAPPRRTHTADAGPATGAMSPEDLLADDDGEARHGAEDDVKILGRSVTDLEAPPSDGGEDDPEPEADEPPKFVSRLSRRRVKPKRGFRLRGKGKADVEPDMDDLASDAPTVGDDRDAPKRASVSHSAQPSEDVPAGLSDSAELEPEVAGAPADPHQGAAVDSPMKAWLVIIAQVVGGALVGMVLWVGFRYLWGKMPPLALGAALLATAGSVLLVRAIRRTDDLRTSVFAVLVGLVVTVSPAVLVLVSR